VARDDYDPRVYNPQKDAYETLGVTSDASKKDIKKALRRKVSDSHPDVNKSEESHQITVDLNNARDHLIENRGEYDLHREKYIRKSTGTGDDEGHMPESAQSDSEASDHDDEGHMPESVQSDEISFQGLCAVPIAVVIVSLFYFVLIPLSVDKLMGWDTYPRQGIDPIDWVRRWF